MARHLISADTVIRNAKPRATTFRINDGEGLYLLVRPDGAKWWRFDYSFHGKRKTLSLGTYPDAGLSAVRRMASESRKQLAEGVNPSDLRKEQKKAWEQEDETKTMLEQGIPLPNTLEAVAWEWYERSQGSWSDRHALNLKRFLERDLLPPLGARPIIEITPPEILDVGRRIQGRGALVTGNLSVRIYGQIFRYAVAIGKVQRDPTADLKGTLISPRTTHRASITDPAEIGGLLRALDNYHGFPSVCAAIRILPLVFVRPRELLHAEWSEIDLKKAEWNIPATRMKMREPHLVPLSTQVINILNWIKPITGEGRYIFTGLRGPSRPISDNALNGALRTLGYSKETISAHGFRAMARTLLDEVLGVRPDFIEHQLAHKVRDPLGRAYNRTTHLAGRREMMQQWADYLEKLKSTE